MARGVDVDLKQFFVEAAFENLRWQACQSGPRDWSPCVSHDVICHSYGYILLGQLWCFILQSTSGILGGQEQVVGRKHRKHRQCWTHQSHETMTLYVAALHQLFWMLGLRCQGSLDQRGAWVEKATSWAWVTVDLSPAKRCCDRTKRQLL